MSDTNFNPLKNFLSRDSRWPNSEQSVGKKYLTQKQKTCWEAIGPAREAFVTLGLEIKDYLNNSIEQRPGTEPVSFSIYMIGRNATRAVPTLLFCSEDCQSRKVAQDAVNKSGLLDRYPGIKTGNAPHAPELESHGPLQPLALDTMPLNNAQTSCHSGRVGIIRVANNKLFTLHNLRKHSKAHIATVGGIVRCDERTFLFTAGHPFETAVSYVCPDTTPMEDEGWELDSDHGSEVTDFDDCMESSVDDNPRTSQAQLIQNPHREAVSGAATTSLKVSRGPLALNSGEVTADEHPITAFSTTLDYALIEVSTPEAMAFGEAAEGTMPPNTWQRVCPIPTGVRDCKILSFMASSGSSTFSTGTLSATPSFIRMPNSKRFQMTYRVDFDAPIFKGDCGSWILDAETRGLYGHLIAGCERSTVAYIVPSVGVFEEVQNRLGSNVELYCHSVMETRPPTPKNIPHAIEFKGTESSRSSFHRRTGAPDTFECNTSLGGLSLDNATVIGSRKAASLEWQSRYSYGQTTQKANHGLSGLDYNSSPLEEDFLTCLLRDDIESDISPEADAIDTFLRGASLPALQGGKGAADMTPIALFDQKKYGDMDGCDNNTLAPLTAKGLYQTSQSTAHQKPKGARPGIEPPNMIGRRLIWIPNIDASSINTLLSTASKRYILVLQAAIYHYLVGQSFVSVATQTNHGLPFSLSFSLPYYALRSGDKTKDHRQDKGGKSLRHSHDVSFLYWDANDSAHYSLYEAQISCTITGLDEECWTAYCFIDTWFDTTDRKESVVRYRKDFVDSGELYRPDPLTRGLTTTDTDVMDPREYFLMVLRVRLAQATSEWQRLIENVDQSERRFRRGLQFWDKNFPERADDAKVQEDSGYTRNLQKLARDLLFPLSETIHGVERLLDNDAIIFRNLPTFQEPPSCVKVALLRQLRSLVVLRQTLEVVSHRCEEHNRDRRHYLNHLAVELGNKQAQLATVNKSLLVMMMLFVSPLALASGLFSLKAAVLPFPATLSSFLTCWFTIFLFHAAWLFIEIDQSNGSLIKHFRAVEVWVPKLPRKKTPDFRKPPPDSEALWANRVDDLPLLGKACEEEKGGNPIG
ncbi:uncharacterized protein A1O9_02389 [Exophiala aquamarina CBS 119918]|uniref:Uncharacterized protein n=1 Tax=Exophiala aquamarina CBS 119918 TaxID=1182545 RepID=A0A072PM81_9EURO|nr:uncharacterized protein A1O9_02389 [Exophiala aquamarina CBS 119918]KEF60827.1 hypothetical protein A1O9_02389 [Exophiala aquamarina CBS 119918]